MNERTIKTDIVGDYLVSTVRLPVTHHNGDYETMVFAQSDGEVTDWTDRDCRRYSTKEEAEEGHARVVEEWKDGPPARLDSFANRDDSLGEVFGTIMEGIEWR